MILLRTDLCLPWSELSHTAHVILNFRVALFASILHHNSAFIYNALLCVLSWSLSGSEQFALRYADGPQLYITEQVSAGVYGKPRSD